MSRIRIAILLVALFAGGATPALADATAFIGANTTPTNHAVRGLALGLGILFAIEFEYAGAGEDLESGAPALRTGMINGLLQPPFAIGGVQPYATFGAGLYREQLDDHRQTGIGANLGGGVKVSLVGPLRLRVDYRVFRLGEDALHSPAHRVYAGLNLRF
jgi:hypothetical protein